MNKFNIFLYGIHGRKPHKGGGGGGGGTSTTTQEIPAELKPLATRYSDKAIQLSDSPYQGYEGQRYADLTPTQNVGIGLIQQRALGGNPTFQNAEKNLNQVISGQENPYLDSAYNQAASKVSDSVNSNFSSAGRYGSGAHTDVLSENLGDLATNIYGGAYDADQGRRLQAIGQAPAFANQQYQDASQLLNAGQIQQDQAQNNLDFGYQQFQDEQNDPYKKLAAMAAVFGSNLGGGSTTQSSPQGGGK
jgi:hypothetical protein